MSQTLDTDLGTLPALTAQDIRATALQAAWPCLPSDTVLQVEDVLAVARRFEAYITDGTPAQPEPVPWLNPVVFDIDLSPRRFEDIRKRVFDQISRAADACGCDKCAEAKRRLDELDTPAQPEPEPEPVPMPLADELAERMAVINNGIPAAASVWDKEAQAAIDVFRDRIGAIPSSTTADEVYRTLFGAPR